MSVRFQQGLCVALAGFLAVSQARGQTPKPETLSSDTLKSAATEITLRIVSDDGDQTASAVCVSETGHFITKASEWPKGESRAVLMPDGTKLGTREVRRIEALDLLVGQCQGGGGFKIARWADSKVLTEGRWLFSITDEGSRALLGVVSALRRKIPRDGVAMGVRMEDSKGAKGVLIAAVSSESPAEEAGLMADDILVRVNGQDVTTFQAVKKAIAMKQPGDVVEVCYKRAGKEQTAKLRLASRKKALGDWSEDFANGGVSTRTDDFPEVIQHAISLNPEDMGSPLLTLDGAAVGINIARVDRITTFALPMELFWPQVREVISKDQTGAKDPSKGAR